MIEYFSCEFLVLYGECGSSSYRLLETESLSEVIQLTLVYIGSLFCLLGVLERWRRATLVRRILDATRYLLSVVLFDSQPAVSSPIRSDSFLVVYMTVFENEIMACNYSHPSY